MLKYLPRGRYLIQVRFGLHGDWNDYHKRCWTLTGARNLRWRLIQRDGVNPLPFYRIFDTHDGQVVE